MTNLEKLLKGLQEIPNKAKTLLNNIDTWARIGNKDSSIESELGKDVASWIAENPYSDMSNN